MTVRVLTGSKQEIAREVAGIDGDVREAIVFVEDASAAVHALSRGAEGATAAVGAGDLFGEMDPYTVAVDEFDDSREAIYSRRGDE